MENKRDNSNYSEMSYLSSINIKTVSEHLCWPNRTNNNKPSLKPHIRRNKNTSTTFIHNQFDINDPFRKYGSFIFILVWCVTSWSCLPLSAAENLQAPRFLTHPSASGNVVSEGLTKILQCHALGYPQPEYQWWKDDEPLGDFTPEHFYKIQAAQRKDAGSYQCIARNEVGAIFSEKIQVIVAYMAPFLDQSDRVVTVISGQAAVFHVPPIESSPLPSVSWQANDSSLLYGINYANADDYKLVILSVTNKDQKSYRARATNTQVGQEENSGYLQIVVTPSNTLEESPPEIVVSPKDTEVIKGKEVTELYCIANYANAKELHLVETIWLKDGIPIERSRVSYSFHDPWNRTLSLLSVDVNHTGQYMCVVQLRSRGFAPVKAVANVTVLEKPRLLESMERVTLGEFGKVVTLPCVVEGAPYPSVVWLRNTIKTEDIPGKRYTIAENGSLKIQKLQMEDSGMFQCVATNKAGEASSYTWLKVKKGKRIVRRSPPIVRVRFTDLPNRPFSVQDASAPVMINPPQNLTVLDGKDATITCVAGGAPMPNVTWTFNNEEVSLTGRKQLLDQGNLLIAAIRTIDAGKYRCVRSNEAGTVEASGYLSVLVRTQIIQPPVDTRIILGHLATLQCRVSSDPAVPYTITWYHDRSLVQAESSERINILADGTLEIQQVRASDVGEYTCLVTSTGGNDTRGARLHVIELPFAPTNVHGERLNTMTKAVNVTWVPGFDGNSPILKFIIQKRVVGLNDPLPDSMLNWVTELANVSSEYRSVVLTNLKAAASYQFRVSAVNSVGEGSPSAPSNRVTLPQEPPSGPPVGLVGSARSPSQIIIQWQPPDEEHRNGAILGYLVRYRLYGYLDSPWSYRNITTEAQRNYLIKELITFKDYEIQLASYNNKGTGRYTDSIRVKTREGVPEAAPTEVRVEAVNSTTIHVWWKPPDPQKVNGINQGYKLQAWRGDPTSSIDSSVTLTVPPSPYDPLAEQSAMVPGLEKYTEYNITVLCFTNPGDGKKSEPMYVKTEQDTPGAVGSLTFEEITDRAVTVVWTPPDRINGILQGYSLRYMIKDQPLTQKVKNATASTHSVRVNQLQASTHYYFEMYAWTIVGSGPSKSAIIQSGVEPVLPDPPTRLGVTNIEAFSVVLQFTPGFDGNSSITKWTIQARTSRNSTWYTIYEVSNPDATTITVRNLIPYMQYQLRLLANNVVGVSVPSEPTKQFQTLQGPPSHAPHNVTVRALGPKQLRVRWIPLQQIEWYGIPRGYNISYHLIGSAGKVLSISIEDHSANSYVLDGLEEYALYQVIMQAYNDVGTSGPSPVAVERTRESVPSAGPVVVSANATSSTTIVVVWGDIPKAHQNGLIEGYKIYYGAKTVSFKYKQIDSNSTFTATLTELRKFTQYHVQVLAYTRVGDGDLSNPPVLVQTLDDVPGVPSNVSFPDVSFTMARVIWDVPEEPNGEILAYRVTYHYERSRSENFSMEFPPTSRTYRATDLEQERYYLFTVTARTRLGWGMTAKALVYTTNNREAPQPPSAPHISQSQVQSSQISFSWAPGRDGFAPVRYYTVQYTEDNGPWVIVPERLSPLLSSHIIQGLKPFTQYRFRIQATNDIGPSGWSQASDAVRTLPAAPSKQVNEVKVVPITTTSVRVTWETLPFDSWNGDSANGGYRVEYHQISDFPTAFPNSQNQHVEGVQSTQSILNDLTRDRNYEITIVPVNLQGDGPSSLPVTVYVGEAVPTGEPREVQAEAVSSTEVRLKWSPPLHAQQNGDLLGYKIFYLGTGESHDKEEIEVVPASYTSHSLVFLDMYTEYTIEILAFNPAGDGPRSQTVTVKTMQGLPGPPGPLQFYDITMTTLRVSWDLPLKPNGQILGYLVTYETAHQNEDFSKQVKQRVTGTHLTVTNLEEEVSYTFSVRAQTLDLGSPSIRNVTTGPQSGSPGRPKNLVVTKSMSSVELQWENGVVNQQAPILGFYIESRRKDEEKWQMVVKTDSGPITDFLLSYQNLLPSTSYIFRVIAYNKYGISYPASSEDAVLTPSKLYLEYGYLQQKPFYRQTWFLVAIAAASIIIIILTIAVLCVKSKSYKYKKELAQKSFDETSVDENTTFPSVEMRHSKRSSRFSTLASRSSRKSAGNSSGGTLTVGAAGKQPPRPSPATVLYSDDDSVKGYDENPDDSSLTEKPSEISSTDSQATESENESEHSDPHSFVNHYANVNDTFRQSWKKQKPVKNYSSLTDSEPEGSAVMSLNGGQIVMNNMARSRAPLPGFSSFV